MRARAPSVEDMYITRTAAIMTHPARPPVRPDAPAATSNKEAQATIFRNIIGRTPPGRWSAPQTPSGAVQQPNHSELFGVRDEEAAKDIVTSLILSEAVYKVMDTDQQAALQAIRQAASEFPVALQQELHLQWSLGHVDHRYLIAEGKSSVYVAFMGTKSSRDILTNAALVQDLLWEEHRYDRAGEPAAHSGFVRRARSIPIHDLQRMADSRGKRLILCGHSLGASVAEICGLDLLHEAAQKPKPRLPLKVIGFAAPAIGNLALAEYVRKRGWQSHLTNYILPEDRIASLLSFPVEDGDGTCQSEMCTPKQPSFGIGQDNGARLAGASNNIVAFRTSSSTVDAETGLEDRAHLKHAFSVWSAKRAYHAVTFPLWASKSFASISRRLYLNPTGIGVRSAEPEAALLAAESLSRFQHGSIPPQTEPHSPTRAPGEPGPSRGLTLLMHRLPVYRTRLLQFIRPPPFSQAMVNQSGPASICIAQDLASRPVVHQASLLSSGLTACLRFEEGMHASSLCNLLTSVWTDSSQQGLSSQPKLRLGTLLTWLWSALLFDLLFRAIIPRTQSVYVSVKGHCLQHARKFSLNLPGGHSVSGQVVGEKLDPSQWLNGRKETLARMMSWAGNTHRKHEALLLKFSLTSTQVELLREARHQVLLEYKSDFYIKTHQVKASWKHSLLEQRLMKAVHQPCVAPSVAPECVCQHC